MADYTFRRVLVFDTNPGSVVRLLRNGTVTVHDATSIAPEDAGTGTVLTVAQSDSDGSVSLTLTVPTVDFVSPNGFVERVTSPDAFAEASTAAASAASSAADAASAASDAAAAAALVGAPAGSAMDAYMGGSASGLVPVVNAKVTKGDQGLDVVTQYNAPTDGVTNAASAIASAGTAGVGRRLLLRSGTYYLASRVTTIGQGTVIEGEDPLTTKLLMNTAAFECKASDVLVRNLTFDGGTAMTRALFSNVTTGAFKNWRFENCRFIGVGVVLTRIGAVDDTGTTVTTGTGHDSYVEFDRCEFFNYTIDGAIYSKGVHDVTVNRCHFHDLGASTSAGDNVKMAYGAQDWRILHNLFENGTRDAIDCYDGQRGLIEGNTMRNMGVHAVEIKVQSATAPNPADRIRVIGNYAYQCGNGSSGPSMQLSSSNLIVQGNTIEASRGYGYRCGKTIDGTANSKDITLMGNHAIGCVNHGFTAVGVDRITYIGNNSKGSTTGKGYDVGALNSAVIGGATLNQSSGNAVADAWS